MINHAKKGGDVDTLYSRQFLQEKGFGTSLLFSLHHTGADLQNGLLAVSDHHDVKKIRYRLGVGCTWPACNNQGEFIPSVPRPDRNTGEIEHVQNVGVAQLVLKGKTQDIKLPQGARRLQRRQRDPSGPHETLHVGPWGKDPFRGDLLCPIEDVVKDLQSQMGHAHLIHIRKG